MLAFTREVSPSITECLLTCLDRLPINIDLLRQQHAGYEAALRTAGAEVKRFKPLPSEPDAVFVEDTAIMCGDHAVITRPGAAARRSEIESAIEGLKSDFELHYMDRGIMDGGDVLLAGNTFYVGQSTRTDREGFECFASIVQELGYKAIPVPVHNCLHVLTGASYAGISKTGREVVLYQPGWIDETAFKGLELLAVSAEEGFAVNVLPVGDKVIVSSVGPQVADNLTDMGYDVLVVEVSEFHKAEGSLTCLSLVS